MRPPSAALVRSLGFAAAAAVATFLAAGAGCATKEITLEVMDGDAGTAGTGGGGRDAASDPRFPQAFCLSFADATSGQSCTACYDEWGTETSRQCKPTPVKCYPRDEVSGTHCLYCDDNPTVARACLKCDAPDTPNMCAACQWSDTGAVCKRCFDAAGVLLANDCDSIRDELRP